MSGYLAGSVFGVMIMLFFIIFYVAIIGLSIFVMVLMIQFLRKGNTALDIWIRKNDDRPKPAPRPRNTGSYQPNGYPGGYQQPRPPQNGYPYGNQPPVSSRQNVPPVPPVGRPPMGQPPVNQPPFGGAPSGAGYQGSGVNQGWQPQGAPNGPAAPVPPVPPVTEAHGAVPPAAPAVHEGNIAPVAPVGTEAPAPVPELTLEPAMPEVPVEKAAGEQAAVTSENEEGVELREAAAEEAAPEVSGTSREQEDEVVKTAEENPPAEK